MKFCRTVLGDIPARDLGVCYAHEHLIIERSFVTQQNPEFLLDDVHRAARELVQVRMAGGRAMVDSMPAAAGRNVVKLARLSEESGIHIIAPTGIHLAYYYPHNHWSQRFEPMRLARLFVDEITSGIDANDLNGPAIERTAHKAGLIKIATGLDHISDFERRVFEAAAIAQRATGAPILTHTEKGTMALEQVRLLESLGVAPQRVVLSHTDRVPDAGYHREILATGVNVEYDNHFRFEFKHNVAGPNPTLTLVTRMIEDGFGKQIMLGMDAARRGYWRSYDGEPGLCYLLEEFTNQLEDAGVTRAQWEDLFVNTPARVYAIDAE